MTIKHEKCQSTFNIEDKIREIRPRWFDHVHRGPKDETERKIYCFEVTSTSRGRENPKETWIEIVRNELKALI